jgi:hypothetical protein
MVAESLAGTHDLEAPSSTLEHFALSEDTKNSILDQHNEENIATKWEIWAYYACVACSVIQWRL